MFDLSYIIIYKKIGGITRLQVKAIMPLQTIYLCILARSLPEKAFLPSWQFDLLFNTYQILQVFRPLSQPLTPFIIIAISIVCPYDTTLFMILYFIYDLIRATD